MPYKDPEKRRAHNKSCSRKWAVNHPEKKQAAEKRWRLANPEKTRAKDKRWKTTHPGYYRGIMLKRKYGLTLEAFEAMLRGQGGKCASCRTTAWGYEGPCVDHDHATGEVRGILCHDCNTSEGLLKTSARVQALANYMKRNKI